MTYHFDLFHANTKLCSSEFLLQVENVTFHQNKTTKLPLDYQVSITEDVDVGHILTAVNVEDAFSQGPFIVTLYSGTVLVLSKLKK